MKCLTPSCHNDSGWTKTMRKGSRGLCRQCYIVASRFVRQGRTTWEELERLNLASQPSRSTFEEHLKSLGK